MVTSQQQMPQRLELFFNNLNKQNMRRRLFYIYKWMQGRREANRDGYLIWLQELSDWFEKHVNEEGAKNQEERFKKMQDKLADRRNFNKGGNDAEPVEPVEPTKDDEE